MKRFFLLLLLVGTFAGCCGEPRQSYLILLEAGPETREGSARALHAMLYAAELKRSGHEVTLLFDGAGTEWARDLRDAENPLRSTYQKMEEAGVKEIICEACSRAFHVDEALKEGKVPLVSEFEGHPSLSKWLEKGYAPLVF